jgi:hypothetical protein
MSASVFNDPDFISSVDLDALFTTESNPDVDAMWIDEDQGHITAEPSIQEEQYPTTSESEDETDDRPTRVVTVPLHSFIGIVFEEMRSLFHFEFEPNAFHGDRISLRWRSFETEGLQRVEMNALSEAETANYANDDDTFILGKYWRAYERSSPTLYRPGSPVWRYHIELGVELGDYRGVFLLQELVLFPEEPDLREIRCHETDYLPNAEAWDDYKQAVLERMEGELLDAEAEVMEGQSNDSTDRSEDEELMEGQ